MQLPRSSPPTVRCQQSCSKTALHRKNVHFCTFMRNYLPPATFMHGTFTGQEQVANTELPVVLIVEDDFAIQAIVDEALIDAGFETAIAASAEEAVTLLKGKVANYRALVTDINLKGLMNGWQVAKAAREIDPAFPIVYMTGAAAGDWPSHGVPNRVSCLRSHLRPPSLSPRCRSF